MKMRYVLIALGCLIVSACVHVSTEPIEVKPIHITMDINIRVDRQLDDFFAFQNQPPQPATRPAASVNQ